MGDFLMPSLGADMDSGTILEWRVGPGDVVHRGDIVAVVDTDKSDIDVEVFEDGVVEALLVDVGNEVAVGTPLARIAPAPTTGAARPEPAKPAKAERAPKREPKREPKRQPRREPAPPRAKPEPRRHEAAGEHVRASGLARRRASEGGIDLTDVRGSGPGGAVVAADLTLPAEPPSAPRPRSDRQASGRRAVGELMARSKREIPHYYLATTIDLGDAMAWLTERNAGRPVTERVLPAALLLKATALAARRVPTLNGLWDGAFQPSDAVHLGVAVSRRGGGLVAPAIRDADALSLDDLMAALRDLVERARSGRLRGSQMSDPTITVTNLGDRGADEVYGVIYPPQVALVGFGAIVERPWAIDGLLGIRPTVRTTLAADHRATDGHEGSRILAAIDELLHTPEDL